MRRLREIAEAATPGPWRDVGDCGVGGDPGEFVVFPHDGHYGGTEIQADATFIATFDPSVVRALLDVADAAGHVLTESGEDEDLFAYRMADLASRLARLREVSDAG